MRILSVFVFASVFLLSCDGNSNKENSSSGTTDCGIQLITYEESQVYPGPGSLRRPEDGRQLPDGRLVVADEYSGMWLIDDKGYGRPFGKFEETGFRHAPPEYHAGPNGIFLEKDGKHLLMADIFTGRIYRVNTATEEVQMIYQHQYGVNSLCRDSYGNIWFTQSTKNEEGSGMEALLADFDHPKPNGAIYLLSGKEDEFADSAKIVITGLFFANGLAIDNDEKFMYVSETAMDRILRFRIAPEQGILVDGKVHAKITTPDNLIVDSNNRLFAASPLENRVYMIDPVNRSVYVAFEAPSAANSQYHLKWMRRTRLGEPVSDLFTPDMTRPLTGLLTGMFLSTDEKTLYITGTGTSILKCPRP